MTSSPIASTNARLTIKPTTLTRVTDLKKPLKDDDSKVTRSLTNKYEG